MWVCSTSVVLPISPHLNLSFLYFRLPNLMLLLWGLSYRIQTLRIILSCVSLLFFPPQNTIRMLKTLLLEQLKRPSRSSSLTINLTNQVPLLGLSVWYMNCTETPCNSGKSQESKIKYLTNARAQKNQLKKLKNFIHCQHSYCTHTDG